MCEPSKLTGVSNFLTGLQQTTHKRTVQSRETKYSRCVGVAKKRCLGYISRVQLLLQSGGARGLPLRIGRRLHAYPAALGRGLALDPVQ